MSIKFNSIPTKTLAESITSAASSFRLNNITGWDGGDLVAGDFGSTGYGVFRNATNTTVEFFEFDPSTIASSSITITRRGLYHNAEDLTTEVSANKLSWTKGDTYVDLGTDTPQMLQWMKEYIDTASIAGAVPMTPVVQGIALLSTAAATPSAPVVVGDNDPRVPTADENNALAGASNTPSATNKFVTEDDLSDPTFKAPVVTKYDTADSSTSYGASDTQFDITDQGSDTFRYTWDGIGTDPTINTTNFATGRAVLLINTGMSASNEGYFIITGSGTNYFEVTNADGTAEVNKTIGASGQLRVVTTPQTWTKSTGVKYVVVEMQAAGGGGHGADTDTASTSCAAAGGGGGFARKLILSSSLRSTEPLFVGVGGTGGSTAATPTAGTDGKPSLFGEHFITYGGEGASGEASPGGGGSSLSGDFGVDGGSGTQPVGSSSDETSVGGHAHFGHGGFQDHSGSFNQTPGYGGGGAGGYENSPSPTGNGQAGGNGIIILTEYYS